MSDLGFGFDSHNRKYGKIIRHLLIKYLLKSVYISFCLT